MIKNKYLVRFFEEPDDNKGGGTAVFDEPVESGGEVEVQEEPKPDAAPAPTHTVDAKSLAKEFGDVLKPMMEQRQAPDKKELTPEEAKKLLKVWEPDDAFLAEFGNLETQKAALGKLRDGLVNQTDTLTQYRLKQVEDAIEAKYGPALRALEEMQTNAREERFNKQYPPLANPKLKPVLEAVAQQFVKQGKKFDDEPSMFKALAEGVESVIKETNADFKLQPAGSTPAAAKTNNSIPVTTPGSGGGGGGKSGGKSDARPRGVSVFDK